MQAYQLLPLWINAAIYIGHMNFINNCSHDTKPTSNFHSKFIRKSNNSLLND